MRWNRYDWIALVAVTVLAAVLRIYELGVVPPGFQFDEAFNAIDAQQVLAGNRPLFLPANAGREVVYTYWQAFLVSLFGLNVRTLRLASALFGILAVPGTYVLLRIMLRRNSRAIALFTSLVLAISLWHIHFSHYGIRVIMMPVIFSITFGAYWLGDHAQRKRWRIAAYLVSGVFLGLSVWTHPTGRLAPFVILIYTGWLLWQKEDARRLHLTGPLGGLVLTGLVAFLVFLPLGLEFVRHPDFFFGHASEVSVFAERVSGDSPLFVLGWNILRVLGMFAVAGDREWTHNLVGRPVFDLAMALVFIGGVAIWVSRIVHGAKRSSSTGPDAEPDADALFMLAAWSVVMLLPSVFSEAAPNYSRTLPSLPALFVAAGLGLTWLSVHDWPFRHAGVALAGIILLYSGFRSTYDYFVVFPAQEEVYYLYDADKLDALEHLADYTDTNTVYLSNLWGDFHATVSMLRGEHGIKSLDTSDTLVLPPAGTGAVYAFPSEQEERAQQLAALWPEVEPRPVADRFGNTLLFLVEVPAQVAHQLPQRYEALTPSNAAFARAPDLVGLYADVPDKQATLLWLSDEPMVASLTSYLHLIDPDGRRVAQIDKLPGNGSYRTEDWSVGEKILDRYYPTMIDPCAAGVPLRAQVGWYAREEGHSSRPRADASGETALAGTLVLPILSHEPGYLRPQNEASQPISADLSFRGLNFSAVETQPGSPVTIDLYWLSEHEDGSSPLHADMPISLTLTSDDSAIPVWTGPLAPDSDWDPGEEICRRVRTRLPTDLDPGTYRIQVEMGTIEDAQAGSIELRTVDVVASTRLFDAPSLPSPLDAVLASDSGDQITLLGAQAGATEGDLREGLNLTLVWRADTNPEGNYHVFVHVVDEAGNIVSQSDATPGPDYATSRWIAGEIVMDQHQIFLPIEASAGRYRVVAGLYDPVSADRLVAQDAAGGRYPHDAVTVHEFELP